jgi:disulfide bond formation protein DsbB
MIGLYIRIAVVIVALIGAAILFAFAFSVAAVVVLVLVLIGLVFGRKPGGQVWVWRQEATRRPQGPLTIDHDPNDLPPGPKP